MKLICAVKLCYNVKITHNMTRGSHWQRKSVTVETMKLFKDKTRQGLIWQCYTCNEKQKKKKIIFTMKSIHQFKSLRQCKNSGTFYNIFIDLEYHYSKNNSKSETNKKQLHKHCNWTCMGGHLCISVHYKHTWNIKKHRTCWKILAV